MTSEDQPVGVERLPFDTPLDERFPSRVPVYGVEGGTVYLAAADGRSYVIIDEGSQADFVEPADEGILGQLVAVYEFESPEVPPSLHRGQVRGVWRRRLDPTGRRRPPDPPPR